MLDPLRATRRIHDEYRRYLRSTFPLRRPDLTEAFNTQLDGEFPLAKGPYLQVSAPYASGASLTDLVHQGVLDERMLALGEAGFPVERPLHRHQEVAVRKAVGARRNLL